MVGGGGGGMELVNPKIWEHMSLTVPLTPAIKVSLNNKPVYMQIEERYI